jgi:carbonic anhydrase/acetyltransferase-like protein (isoleucine patch superfamily)
MPIFFIIQLAMTFSLMTIFVLVYEHGIEPFGFHPTFTFVLALFCTYIISILVLASLNKISRIVMKTKEGKITGMGLFLWVIQETSLDIALNLSHKFMIHTPTPDLLYRLFGFKLRKGVSILTRLWDPDLLDVGENTLVGTDAVISGHFIKDGILYRKRVKIGKNVTIGARCTLGVGVVVGDNTIIAYGSTVPPNAVLDPNCFYSGVPVKKIKTFDT